MSEMNIFEQASRQKLRLPSVKGLLTAENLWDLPLQSKSGFDLDTVAKTVNSELKAQAEESFVSTNVNPQKAVLELALEVVKHVIAVRMDENEKARQRAKLLEERQKLIGLLANKQDEALKGLSEEQLKAKLAEIEAKV